RDNPAGPHREYWHHVNGCRAWIVMERDTLTHEIYSIAPASPNLPVSPQGGKTK
ncbi:MAG: sarcosine oxidase subunit delta, partial [Chromatiales bacterium]|nr:sarcosine oxidase subunit delta [Chromatiales bacterium]